MVSVLFIVPSFFLSFVHSGGFLTGAGQARDVAGDDDADRDEVHGDLPGRAVRLVSQAAVAMARLPSDGVSGPHTNGAIACLRGGR
jgi:hypothetical protein